MAVVEYLKRSEDEQVQGAVEFQIRLAEMGKECLVSQATEILTKYQVPLTNPTDGTGGGGTKNLVNGVRACQVETLVSRLTAKKIHGIYARQTRQHQREPTNGW